MSVTRKNTFTCKHLVTMNILVLRQQCPIDPNIWGGSHIGSGGNICHPLSVWVVDERVDGGIRTCDDIGDVGLIPSLPMHRAREDGY